MPPWEVGELPPAPDFRWRNWTALVGPGLMMAGANIGGGEWLFGPAVTAQYGGTLMWLAALSIILQMFYNLEVMRYTLYCGEPVVTGFFRMPPGPRFWTWCYIALDFGAIWPYLASNAAVPLAAAFLRTATGEPRLPGPEDAVLVKSLGYGIFLLAFLPLIFGGKIYNALEKVMVAKIILVLGYLTFIAVFVARPAAAGEVFAGFFRFGTVPLRAQTIIVENRFTIARRDSDSYVLKGTLDKAGRVADASLEVTDRRGTKKYTVKESTAAGPPYVISDAKKQAVSAALHDWFEPKVSAMLREARAGAAQRRFLMRYSDNGLLIEIGGTVGDDRRWHEDHLRIGDAGKTDEYTSAEQVPESMRRRVRRFIANQGLEPVNLLKYLSQKGHLPPLEWGVLAGFAAIAGAGGLSNAQFSNYARDKGWGMGPLVGAIPSAVGGQTIELSHVGMVFRPTPQSLPRWRGWFRHIVRDQLLIWMGGCFVGMALPAILSLEYIRNAPVSGDRVAAMTAQGIAQQTGLAIFWPLTLLCGFLVLAPSQVANMDGIIRRWTDVIWTGSPWFRHLEGNKVKYLYYSIMVGYGLWGLFALWKTPNPLVLAMASTVFMNLALGFSSFHTLWVNLTLLPRELRPNWLMRIGLVCCGTFFLGVCTIALSQQLPALAAWLRGGG
jgi:hypothetical protein